MLQHLLKGKLAVRTLTEGASSGLDGEYGGRSKVASVGASVARDSEARLSMIKFTHSCNASTTCIGTTHSQIQHLHHSLLQASGEPDLQAHRFAFLMQQSCLGRMHGLYHHEATGLGANAVEGHKAGHLGRTICTAVRGDSCSATAPTAAVTTATMLTTSCTGTTPLMCGATARSMLPLAMHGVISLLSIGVGAVGLKRKTPSPLRPCSLFDQSSGAGLIGPLSTMSTLSRGAGARPGTAGT